MSGLMMKKASSPCRASAGSYQKNSIWAFLSLLLGALIVAQTLGLMHPLLHVPHGHAHMHSLEAGSADHAVNDHAHGQAEGPHAVSGHASWLEALFAGHEDGSNSCRVFDQQGHTALTTVLASLVLPSVLCAVPPPAAIACRQVAAAAPFEARAPPFFR